MTTHVPHDDNKLPKPKLRDVSHWRVRVTIRGDV